MRDLVRTYPGLLTAMCVAAFLLTPPLVGHAVAWLTGNFWDGFGATIVAGVTEMIWVSRLLGDEETA